MPIEQPFDYRGAKIAVINAPGMYNDLLGGVLDTSKYLPWTQVIAQMRDNGVNLVTLIVSGGAMARATDAGYDASLNFNPDLAAIRALASLIQANGMAVAVNTFFNVANVITGDSGTTLDRPSPTDRLLWQANTASQILKWAAFAKDIGATTFIPYSDETQLLLADASLTAGWISLNEQIRKVFPGVLSSGWYTPGSGTSISSIPTAIIQQLDVLGIGLFPNLSRDTQATTEALTAAYRRDADGNDVIAFLKDLATTYGKKIWVSDKAFHSFDGAASDEARIFNNAIPLTADAVEQGRLYDSFLQAMSQEGGAWMAGVSFQNFNNVQDSDTNLPRYLNGPLSESPQGKPAEAIMAAWFNGSRQGSGVSRIDGLQSSALDGGYHHDSLQGGLGNDTLQGFAGNDNLAGGSGIGVTGSGSGSGAVSGYNIVVTLRGVLSQNESPVVVIRDAAGASAVRATVSGRFDPSLQQQTGEATQLRFAVDALSSFSIDEINWAYVDSSASGNRFIRLEAVSINGVSLDLSRYATYVPGSAYPSVVGALDTVHGGKIVLNMAQSAASPVMLTLGDNDLLDGGSGNDTLFGGAGNDSLQGGSGADTALYSGKLAAYTLSKRGSETIVHAKDGSEGDDVLSGVESLRFADMTVDLTVQGLAAAAPAADVQRLIELYVAFFNRVPDAAGLAYWIAQASSGVSLKEIAEIFYSAGIQYAELTGFSATMTNADFINTIYRNVLGRPDGADAGGLSYWTDKLLKAEASRSSLVDEILIAAHAFKGDATWGWVADLLDNKILTGKTFAIDWGLGFATPEASIARGMEIAALVSATDTSKALQLVGIAPADISLG